MNTFERTLCGVVAMMALAAVSRAQDVIVPDAVLDEVGSVLPEKKNGGRKLTGSDQDPNLLVSDDCQVRVAFLWEGTERQNSVGWFRWRETDQGEIEVLDSALLFDDASFAPDGALQTGSTVWLTDPSGRRIDFRDGDRIGFFFISDGYRSAADVVAGWVQGVTPLPSIDPEVNAGLGDGLFTTVEGLNPLEGSKRDQKPARRFAMMLMEGRVDFLGGRSWIVCGMEDVGLNDSSDSDFNDVVLAIDVSPPAAIADSAIKGKDKTDLDGDGVQGLEDLYPLDADRAWVRTEPESGLTVAAYEDFYPTRTDSDFNDAVMAFRFALATDSHSRVKEIFAEFHLVARGASFEHSFGLHLPGIPDGASGTVEIQRYMSSDTGTAPVETLQLLNILRAGRRIDDVFASTRTALPRATADKPFANTWPGHPAVPAASARVRIIFDEAVSATELGAAPFDPFLFVTATDGTRSDVHLPGFEAFADRSAGLPEETGPTAFLHSDGSPWALLVPTAWRCPMEGVPIREVYPQFELWQSSNGTQAKTWYLEPIEDPEKVSVPIEELIPKRDWTLSAPLEDF